MKINLPQGLEEIVNDIKTNGGISYLVGGAVVDTIKGNEIKDWDIEVHGLNLNVLEKVLSKYTQPNIVGKCLGIIKASIDGVEYDFSIPRIDNKMGVGHKDVKVEFVLDITPKQAARRRDLTINSLFYDLETNEIIDPYNGLDDLANGIIRHTSEQFSEDPLRVLRIMQLLPRKCKTVAPETLELCKKLVHEYPTISSGRVYEEWNKLLMKAKKPSIGLDFLVDSGWIKWFPELDALRGVPQNPEWHPEGDVWEHTKKVVDAAAHLKQYIPEDWKLAYMYGALLHDVGKAITTTEDLTSYGHDMAGGPIATEFINRLTNNKKLTDNVIKIVTTHMRPGNLYRANAKGSAWKRLHNELPLNIAAYVSKADYLGTGDRTFDESHPTSEIALELFEKYGQEKIAPILRGRDLITIGYKPGPELGKILKQAYEHQIEEDITDKEILLEKIIKS